MARRPKRNYEAYVFWTSSAAVLKDDIDKVRTWRGTDCYKINREIKKKKKTAEKDILNTFTENTTRLLQNSLLDYYKINRKLKNKWEVTKLKEKPQKNNYT